MATHATLWFPSRSNIKKECCNVCGSKNIVRVAVVYAASTCVTFLLAQATHFFFVVALIVNPERCI